MNLVPGFKVFDDLVVTSQSELNYVKGKGVKSGFFYLEKLTDTFWEGKEVKFILEIVS